MGSCLFSARPPSGTRQRSSRAVVIGITGPIRAGKSLVAGALVRSLHAPRVRDIINDNPALRADDFGAAAPDLGSKFRGPTALWPTLTPEERLVLCFDPWGRQEKLNLLSVGLKSWHRQWAMDAFQIIGQDCYLWDRGKEMKMVEDLRTLIGRIDSDPALSPFIIVEGFELFDQKYMPEEMLPLFDLIIALHASKAVIMARDPKKSPALNEAAWAKECEPVLAELGRVFPWLAPPQRDMTEGEDGQWHRVTEVGLKTESRERAVREVTLHGLDVHVAQFAGPGTDGGDIALRRDYIAERVVRQLASTRKWLCFPGRNCFDGHGGQNVDLDDDNSNPKHMGLDDAKRMCDDEDYAGFTYEPAVGRVWRLREIGMDLPVSSSRRFDVYRRR